MKPGIQPQDLKALRAQHGMTQEDMAVLCGVSLSAYLNWESDRRTGKPSFAAYWLCRIRLEGMPALVELSRQHPFVRQGDRRKTPQPGDGKGRPRKPENGKPA